MFQKERYSEIYAILQERQSVTVGYLQKKLFISEATVRRDLANMEKLGLLQRVWGGAMLPSSLEKDPPSFVRIKENSDKKEAICRIASKLINEGSSCFLSESTTLLPLVPYIAEFKQITIITNGLEVSQQIMEHTNAKLFLLGGQVYENRLVTGSLALSGVEQFHADICFMSCSGISSEYGITGAEGKSVEVCHQMLKRSSRRVLLCDTTKVGKNFLWSLASLEDMDYVIMDSVPADEELTKRLGSRLITSASQLQ